MHPLTRHNHQPINSSIHPPQVFHVCPFPSASLSSSTPAHLPQPLPSQQPYHTIPTNHPSISLPSLYFLSSVPGFPFASSRTHLFPPKFKNYPFSIPRIPPPLHRQTSSSRFHHLFCASTRRKERRLKGGRKGSVAKEMIDGRVGRREKGVTKRGGGKKGIERGVKSEKKKKKKKKEKRKKKFEFHLLSQAASHQANTTVQQQLRELRLASPMTPIFPVSLF
ncbi:hypothetical protein JOL62DRAFT_411886 [Phyllosticta paracitricarpa]|uniref:Uncharacterized protein n=1 Tax=Phyllosticta paracitricarpa TaxID=2016321 RepID=A0ABR1NF64_9PEZI